MFLENQKRKLRKKFGTHQEGSREKGTNDGMRAELDRKFTHDEFYV